MTLLTKIHSFFGKQDLLIALERTNELLDQSENSDWSSLSAGEIKTILEREIYKIKENQGFDKLELAVLYAPTSNIQETAMWNNWHEEYLKIVKISNRTKSFYK